MNTNNTHTTFTGLKPEEVKRFRNLKKKNPIQPNQFK